MASLRIVPSTRSRFSVVAALAVTSAVLLAACSGGGDDDKSTSSKTTKPEQLEVAIDLEAGPAAVSSAGPDVALGADVTKAVMKVLDGYVDAAVAAPLATGKPAKKIEKYFGLRVVTHVGPDGPDRAALTEDGTPKVTSDVTIAAKPVALTALADQSGQVLMVSASIDLRLKTKIDGEPLQIVRTGEVLLEPVQGKWQITGYDIDVKRTTPDGTSTTTAATPTEDS